jgi:glycosyltransferase involved in cell wall biosynthesis
MLAEPNVEGLVQAVKEVLTTPVLADRLKKAGLAFTESTSWEQEAKKLAHQLAAMVDHKN